MSRFPGLIKAHFCRIFIFFKASEVWFPGLLRGEKKVASTTGKRVRHFLSEGCWLCKTLWVGLVNLRLNRGGYCFFHPLKHPLSQALPNEEVAGRQEILPSAFFPLFWLLSLTKENTHLDRYFPFSLSKQNFREKSAKNYGTEVHFTIHLP